MPLIFVSTLIHRTGSVHSRLTRAEAKALQDEPRNYWRMFAAEAPELQALALKLFNQSTNASACEGNWSSFEYIYLLIQ